MPAKVMAEEGIEISRKETKSVFDFHEQAKGYSYVITACDAEAAEHCPIFPHNLKVIEFTDSYREDPVQTIKEAHAPAIEVKMSRGRPAAWNKPEQCPG